MRPGRGVDDGDGRTSVDLLDEIRAALDGLEPLLLGRMVDIEMPRLRVLSDPALCRRLLVELVGYAVAHSEPPDSITVRRPGGEGGPDRGVQRGRSCNRR